MTIRIALASLAATSLLTAAVADACTRAVYFGDAFPLGTLDKILKNKLREMADEQPPVD